ncbi:DNA-binding transcriptional LysR family regulator [Albidovulum inexpectatum]|uniref:DNA-binding transcriptional LysR family regulator n=1 Tax=Albidovulum inexpectatum TaxID=196587 RepID=A0A2S5JIT0_9RHOB|nr:LysR family transcriptional regulator [Albidovulum inexpectatum]PPB81258.1 DNA-binding transcriptional LysR family regulator [Albidovulum inexpectatum]
MRTNWDDIRHVLAVAQEGSVSAAARRLGVNHATVLRRIAAFETAAGTTIFERSARGYEVPAERARLIAAMEDVEQAVLRVARLIEGSRAPVHGEVRVTSTDSLCRFVLPAILADLQRVEPGLRVELLCSNAHLDLGRLHADIAVRPTERLPDDLAGEVAGRMRFGVFRARGSHVETWIGAAGPLSRSVAGRWLASSVPADQRAGAADSFMVMAELAARGLGLALVPVVVGRADARLEPVEGAAPPMDVPVWVASHADLADLPRIATVRRALVRGLARALDA